MTRTVSIHDLSALSRPERDSLLRRAESDLSEYMARVGPVIEAVRAEGDEAVARFGREFDGAQVTAQNLKVTEEEFDRAGATLTTDVVRAIEYASEGIRRFHDAQMPETLWMREIRPGAYAGDRFSPIPSVACYVPRGKGAFPSVVMMTTIPAMVARVPRTVVLTPPGPTGEVDAASLVAARMAGVDEVYKCGGSQAVAAVAYGTETIPKMAKIVGPGSPYVVAAKRQLSDVIDPGTPAGPSESIVLADETADGRIAALDLIIESEHGSDSSAFLVTHSRDVIEAARAAIPEFWGHMGDERVGYSSAVLGGNRGGLVLAPDLDAAIEFVNDYAPEHLQIAAAEPFNYLGRIQHAGEILLGQKTPFTLGNFVLGPNAVLPTSGAAKTASPLSVFDFMKRTSIGYVTTAGYGELARHARVLATYEGFEGHANAVSALRDPKPRA